MTIFSLDEAVVREAVAAITAPRAADAEAAVEADANAEAAAAGEADGEAAASGEVEAEAETKGDVAERFARAAWSGIAEPGDVVAGALVRTLGAARALTALVERHPRSRLLQALADAGVDDITSPVLSQAIERWTPRLAANSALTSMRLAARCGAKLLVPGDPLWPQPLADLGEHEPIALWVRGKPGAIRDIAGTVSLVGARAATGYGEHVAMEFSAGLCDRGIGIVSGAAYGIDGMAHRAALASSGLTVAFLAGGVDRFYPGGHDALLSRIASVGAVVSEMPCGSPPTKWRFLQRKLQKP